MAEAWADNVQRWTTQNRRHKSDVNGAEAPGPNDEYLFYQALIGAWPVECMTDAEPDAHVMEQLQQRMSDFMLKAVREGKVSSSWINQDTAYEQALTAFVDRALDVSGRNPFVDAFGKFASRWRRSAWSTASPRRCSS